MPWRIELSKRAQRDLARLDVPVRKRVMAALVKTARNPEADPALAPLSGREEMRLRVGNWRALVSLDEENLTISVRRILPRGRAYDR